MPEFSCGFSATSLADIEGFERRTGIQLPPDYRLFLLRQNGGQPTPSLITLPSVGQDAIADFLFGLSKSREPGDLEYEFREMRDELSDAWIAIGRDPGGNLILISLCRENRGAVYYGDTAMLLESSNEDNNVYRIADSFTEFLRVLH